jgi:NAD+ synthase
MVVVVGAVAIVVDGVAIVVDSVAVDSAVVAYLAARALGPENVYAFRMPYKISSQESLDHAQLVVDDLGINVRTIPITQMVDGYISNYEEDISPSRLGNVCARCRMITIFDQSAKVGGLPIGTGNKSERLFGYYTWHADDSPPINPIGDLFKTQVWQLARELGVPEPIIDKPASADLIKGQTDESDFGITYAKADRILHYMIQGYTREKLREMGFSEEDVAVVYKRVDGTHWKRRLPTVAMLSSTAIGEYYLRPVDY